MKSLSLFFVLGASLLPQTAPVGFVTATSGTHHDADDPALWVNKANPSGSLIVGTDKQARTGALYVWNLEGREISRFSDLDGPNNVDVQSDVLMGRTRVALVVTVERYKGRLRAFRLHSDGELQDVSGMMQVFQGEPGEHGQPMGIALYQRPDNGRLYAYVSRKAGPTTGYIGMYELVWRGGSLDAEWVRNLGECKPGGEIEALLVDDQGGVLYAAEEKYGIRAYAASPDRPTTRIAEFGKTGFAGDREGMGLLVTGRGRFLLATDQIAGASEIHVFKVGDIADRRPVEERRTVITAADDTDGMDAFWGALGPKFPDGVVIMMDSTQRRFGMLDAQKVLQAAGVY
jgi:3-phytase